MYISKISIKNFRSIKQTEFTLIKGKNVIIGKNNSGKSNILKAIDLVLGKKHLDKDKDIYCENGNKSSNIEIILTIEKDGGNDFDKITQFKVYPVQSLPQSWNGYDIIDTTVKDQWVTNESYSGSITPNQEFTGVKEISIVFSYDMENGIEYYLYYKTQNNSFKDTYEYAKFIKYKDDLDVRILDIDVFVNQLEKETTLEKVSYAQVN
jgi:AAA15 family ATPase/GTPase